MSIGMLLPFIVLIGAMFLMTRSAKKKQQQAVEMRNQMAPGSGVRTIGGMYAVVKEVQDEVVLLELTDGVHAHFAKNAIGAVLDENEFNRIVHGIEQDESDLDGTGEDGADAVVLDKADDKADDTPADETSAASEDATDSEDSVKLSKTDDTGVNEDVPSTKGSDSK